MENRIELVVKGLTYSEGPYGAYALMLGSPDGLVKLPMVIGTLEAQSIALALDKKATPSRPLTHDLFHSVLASFGLILKEIVLYALDDGVFKARLYFQQDAVEISFDARPSDAVALALREQCTMYALTSVVEAAGALLNPKGDSDFSSAAKPETPDLSTDPFPLMHISLKGLEKLLNERLAQENYEGAALVRDEIKRRGH